MSITVDQVGRSYNGKRGCMCGCLGTYTTPEENERRVKLHVNKINKAIATQDPDLIVQKGLDGEIIYAVETDTRITALYLKAWEEA